METIKSINLTTRKFLAIGLVVLFSCFLLFLLDNDKGTIADIGKTSNLLGLLLYFVPTFLVSLFFDRRFSKKNDNVTSFVLSLVTAIPITFVLVICIMYLVPH